MCVMIRGVLLSLDQTRAALRLMMDLHPKMNEGRGMTALQLLVYEARNARRHSSEAKSFFRPIAKSPYDRHFLFVRNAVDPRPSPFMMIQKAFIFAVLRAHYAGALLLNLHNSSLFLLPRPIGKMRH